MAKVVRLRTHGDAEEEAAAWIAHIDKGLSSEDDARFREWLAASRRNARAFEDLASLWHEADELAELARLYRLGRARRRRFARLGQVALVSILLGVIAAVLLVTSRDVLLGLDTRVFAASFETPVGGQQSEKLPDDSLVTLNTDTEVAVEYSAARRAIYLRRGEAHFEVAADSSRPFEVHAGERIVRAVGTAFNMRLGASGRLEVLVTKGEVRLLPATAGDGGDDAKRAAAAAGTAADTSVVAGHVAIVDAGAPGVDDPDPEVRSLEPIDVDTKLAWQRGMLIFRGEPLDEMLQEVARYTTTRFVLADPALAELRVGGYFRAGDVDGLLTALRDSLDIEFERLDDDAIALRAAD